MPLLSCSPTPAQQSWMDLKFGLFLHYGVNTYHDVEWSDGSLDIQKINPTHLDPDAWCAAAKAAGMNYVVLVCKHHDGFCNWDSSLTDYKITRTPWGKDLLAMLADAARRYGLRLGLYYSLWDCHEKSHDEDEAAYVDFMEAQLTELLTGYGEIVELWFDGFWKKQQSGWQNDSTIEGENVQGLAQEHREETFIRAWRAEGAKRWQMDRIYWHIKTLQPDCLVLNNATTAYPGVPLHPVDARSGEKATEERDDQKLWECNGKTRYYPLQIETTLSTKGDSRFPSGNWFWHEWDQSVASVDQIRSWQQTAQNMEANLLINAGPMASGALRPEDLQVLYALGQVTPAS